MNIEESDISFPFRYDPEDMLEMLIKFACPVVCKGHLVPPENWHDVCIDKAERALKVIMSVR
jgi:hypothetical protein